MLKEIQSSIQYKEKTLSVAMKYRKSGDDWIIFVHGLGCAKESFDGAFHVPGLSDYSLCTFDFIGFGGSDKPDWFPYDMQAQADILVEIAQRLSAQRLHLVAHSMGGAVGLLATKHLPQLVSFLNVEGNLVAEDCGLVSREVAKQTEQEFVKKGFDPFVHSLESSDKQDLLAWANWCREADPRAFHKSACSLIKWSDSGQLLGMFHDIVHKSYLQGAKNSYPHLDQHLKHVKRYMISDSGHFMMVDRPKYFYASVANWLEYVTSLE